MKCVFCEIVAGSSPASVIFQDDGVMAFMALRPTAPGECLVIPKEHVDHFTDLDDDMAQRIMLVGQRIGRRLRPSSSLCASACSCTALACRMPISFSYRSTDRIT